MFDGHCDTSMTPTRSPRVYRLPKGPFFVALAMMVVLGVQTHSVTALRAQTSATQGTKVAKAPAGTLRARFAAHLAALKKPGRLAKRHGGALLHWHLSESQRLAASVDGGTKRALQAIEKLSKSSRTPYLRGEALGAKASMTFIVPPAKARESLRAAGVIDRAWVLGPLPSPGTNAGTKAVTPLDLKRVVAGQRAPITWRYAAEATRFGSFQLDDVLDTDGDSHAWLVVGIDVTKATDANVVLGSNGPLLAMLDGKPLVDWDGERTLGDWQHTFPVKLSAGRHHLMVRAGHRSAAPALIMRLVDKNGLLPAGVSLAKAAAADVLGTFEPSTKMPTPVSELGTADPAVAGRIRLYSSAVSVTQRQAAILFEKALAATPDDAELYYLLGRAEASEINRSRAAYEKADALTKGGHGPALAQLIRMAERAGFDGLADRLAVKLGKVDPQDPAYLTYQASRRAQLGDAVSALNWFKKQPGPKLQARMLLAKAELSQAADRSMDAAKHWAAVSVALGGRHEATVRAVGLARRAGASVQGTQWVMAAAKERPWATWPHLMHAQLLSADAKKPRAGLAVLKTLEQRHPDSAELFQIRGQILLEQGNKGGAVAAFDRALELKPQNQTLAERRRSMVSRQSLAQKFAEPVKKVIADSDDEPMSEEGASYLLDKYVVRVHDSGLSSRFTQRIVRVDSTAATEAFETMSFPFTPGEERLQIVQAEVIHMDGTRSRSKAVGTHRPRGKTNGVYTLGAYRVVQFENLEVGDVVHVQVTSDEVGERNLFGSFFGVFLPVQNRFAKRRVIRMIDAPSSRKLYAHGKGIGAPKRTNDPKTQRQTLVWDLSDVPSIATERGMPGYGDVGWYGNVSTYESWKDLADWYRELVKPQLQLSPKLRTLARKLVKGKTTIAEKVAAIQHWVVTNTRYVGIEFGIHGFKPYRVTQVVERAYGDCKDKASLVIALLEEVGVPAEFVLVRTRDLGQLEGKPATLWAFNHAIAYVPALDTYIDGTSEFAGLGEVPALDQGAMILRLSISNKDAPPVLTTLPYRPVTENLVNSTTIVTLASDGAAEVAATETVAGTQAPQIRRAFHDASRRTALLGRLVAQQYKGATVTRSAFTNLAALGKPVSIVMTAMVPSYAQTASDGATLTVPLDPQPHALSDRYGRYGDREQPLLLDFPVTSRSLTTIKLPAGYKATRLPKPVKLSSPFGSLSLSAVVKGGDLVIAEEFILSATRVSPKDYPKFRTFTQQVSAARNASVTLTK